MGDFEELSERTKKIHSQRYNEEYVEINNYSKASSQGFHDDVEQFLKPCIKILNLLKAHKSGWPFKAPVDPVSLNIPNYFQIIKQPMDLQTVEQNIKTKVYSTATQFHSDIKKIIKNSYDFNKSNEDFMKLTGQFEKFYNSISVDPPSRMPGLLGIDNRKKSKKNYPQALKESVTLA